VLSSDAVVHALYDEPEVLAAVRGRFGADVVTASGIVDRPVLGARAFAEEGGVAFLEELLFPLIEHRRRSWIAKQRDLRPAPPLLVCEVPLLFEAGVERAFDAALVVTASEPVRRRRVEGRGQDFDLRAARQLPERDKVARADRAYVNDGDLGALRAWVADRFAEYADRPCDASLGSP
jgi:dephospho-CoA kinase